MIAILPFFLLSVFGQVVHGWGYHESCDSISQQLKDAMAVAFQLAGEARTEIRRTPRNKHVEALVQILFGTDDNQINDAATRLEAVLFLDGLETSKPKAYDVIIYCSTDRITDIIQEQVRVGYHDPDRNANIRGVKLMDNCRDRSRIGDVSTRAITINNGKRKDANGKVILETMADTNQLCPWFLEQVAGPPPEYALTEELVKKAADVKTNGLLRKLKAKLTGGPTAPVDSLSVFENVLLHEMTHSAAAGYSDDVPEGKCYGWKNSAQCQRSDNADTLTLFALGVELILHREYTVNDDGTLQKMV